MVWPADGTEKATAWLTSQLLEGSKSWDHDLMRILGMGHTECPCPPGRRGLGILPTIMGMCSWNIGMSILSYRPTSNQFSHGRQDL